MQLQAEAVFKAETSRDVQISGRLTDSALYMQTPFSPPPPPLCLEDAVATVTRQSQGGGRDAGWEEDVGVEQVTVNMFY